MLQQFVTFTFFRYLSAEAVQLVGHFIWRQRTLKVFTFNGEHFFREESCSVLAGLTVCFRSRISINGLFPLCPFFESGKQNLLFPLYPRDERFYELICFPDKRVIELEIAVL